VNEIVRLKDDLGAKRIKKNIFTVYGKVNIYMYTYYHNPLFKNIEDKSSYIYFHYVFEVI